MTCFRFSPIKIFSVCAEFQAWWLARVKGGRGGVGWGPAVHKLGFLTPQTSHSFLPPFLPPQQTSFGVYFKSEILTIGFVVLINWTPGGGRGGGGDLKQFPVKVWWRNWGYPRSSPVKESGSCVESPGSLFKLAYCYGWSESLNTRFVIGGKVYFIHSHTLLWLRKGTMPRKTPMILKQARLNPWLLLLSTN